MPMWALPKWCLTLVNSTKSRKEITTKQRDLGKTFAIDVATLVSGTTAAQIISIASAPLITRLYGADAFGLSALFTSLVGTIAVIACFRYDLTIMLPKSDEEAANLLALSLLITSIISLILIPIIWSFGGNLASLLNAPGLSQYMWLVPPMVFLTGSFSAINYWNSRKRQFGRLSKTHIARAISMSGTQLGAGYAGYASGGTLIGAGIMGQAIATSTLGYQAWRSDKTILHTSINRNGIVAGIKKYKDFPKFDIWSALINTLSLQMPIFILSAFFTTTIVGYYSLGLMVLQMPMTFIGSAIAQVFFQRAAEAKNASRAVLTSVVENTVGHLIVLGFFPLISLSLIGEDMFMVVFGPTWAEAGVYAQILSFTIFVSFITSPITTLFSVQKKLRAFLLFNIVMMSSRVMPLIWGGINNDIYLGLILLSLFGGVSYFLMGYWILNSLSVSFANISRNVSMPILVGAVILLFIIVGKFFFELGPIQVFIVGIFGFLLYFGIVLAKTGGIMPLLRKITN